MPDDLSCELCPRTASHGVQLELAVSADRAESDTLSLCGEHYDQHIVSALANCRTAALWKAGEGSLNGELVILVYDLNSDDEIGTYKLCSEHGLPLWALGA